MTAYQPVRQSMSEVHVNVAPDEQRAALNELYLRWGYHGGIADSDIVYVARVNGQSVALVRRTFEEGVLMLRGMQVAPEFQRRGLGTRLLDRFVADLPPVDCYCIPFAHLTGFYARAGFEVIDESRAPDFLRERAARYRAEKREVILMRRRAREDVEWPGNNVAPDEEPR